MLGHVATSVGGALPGQAGLDGLISQVFAPFSVTAPAGAVFAFVEMQAPGAIVATGADFASAGGAGNDAIVPVLPGDTFEVLASALRSQTSAGSSLLRKNGSALLSAAYAGQSSSATQAGPAGKYPGGPATAANAPGKGGGRFAGEPLAGSFIASPTGVGSGRRGVTTSSAPGGIGVGCITFFRSYESALAFANSVYGGNWQP